MAVKVGSFAKKADGTGNQAITGVGFQPRALILWTDGSATSADTWTANYRFAVGFTARNAADTITQGSVSAAALDNADTSDASRRAAAKALTIIQWSEAIDSECDCTFDADGFTLNWTTNSANAYDIHYMALGGTSLTDAYVKAWTTGTSNTDVGVTGVGFQPTAVLHLQGPDGALPASAAHSRMAIGAMTAAAQFDVAIVSNDALATPSGGRQHSTSYTLVGLTQPGGNDYTGAYKSLDADGFTVTIASTPAASFNVFSLCLKGGSLKVGVINPKSSAGSLSYTGVGFQPEGVLFCTIDDSTLNTTGTTGLSLGVGATDGSVQAGSLINDQFNVATSNSAGYTSQTYTILNESAGDQGALNSYAAATSMDADGFTLNWGGTPTAARSVHYFAFAGGAAATGHPAMLRGTTVPGLRQWQPGRSN